MLKSEVSLLGILAAVLISVSVIGCVQAGATPDGYESDDDCMFCHALSDDRSAKDLSHMYVTEGEHHPVDVLYPLGLKFGGDFNTPNGRRNDMLFFDMNGNNKLDNDEIRLFPDKGGAEITCASCHREHAKSLMQRDHPDDDFLRSTNANGELCVVCHRKQQKPMVHR